MTNNGFRPEEYGKFGAMHKDGSIEQYTDELTAREIAQRNGLQFVTLDEPEFDRINHGPFEHPVSEPVNIQKAAKATMTYIEQVAAKHGIDLQAEMRKSEEVERTLAELRARK